MPPAAAEVIAGTRRRPRRIGTLRPPSRMCGWATLPTSSSANAPTWQRARPSGSKTSRRTSVLVGRAARGRSDFAGDDVQQVVVGVAGAEAVGRLDVAQPGDDVGAREEVRLGPQHQVAGAFAAGRCCARAGRAPACCA